MFTRIGCEGRPPHFHVEFYPYSSLVITIRRREDAAVRALFRSCSARAARVFWKVRRRCCWRAFIAAERRGPLFSRILSMRVPTARAAVSAGCAAAASGRHTPRLKGRHYDLAALFDRLQSKYFAGGLQRPHIGWSIADWRRQFGCYDPGPNQILLNRRMDRPGIPQFVVEYVLYPRDAPREASHPPLRLHACVPLPGISRRRKALRAVRSGSQDSWTVMAR